METVYNECTCCHRPLSDDEMEENKKRDNHSWTICDECVYHAMERCFKVFGLE